MSIQVQFNETTPKEKPSPREPISFFQGEFKGE